MTVTFSRKTAFARELRRRVNAYVDQQDETVLRQQYIFKYAVIGTWFLASYVGLVVYAQSIVSALLLSTSLGLAMAGVGFAIMHSANHRSVPFSSFTTRALGCTLDLLGASSYVWRFKHNVAHHTYTNIEGKDGDLEAGRIARLSPNQPWKPIHRFQHFYLWPLYSLSAANWILISDWFSIANCKNKFTEFPPFKGHERILLWSGKIGSFALWYGIPLLFRPVWQVLLFSMLTMMVLGLVLAVVFQLAHVVDVLDFVPHPEHGKIEDDWVSHQLKTTANFAPGNRILSWYLGGLNYQIEHHLFAHVPDLYYPKISGIVSECCREFGMPYHTYPTLTAAVVSHARTLKHLGESPMTIESGAAA